MHEFPHPSAESPLLSLCPRLCIPLEFRRIPMELGKKTPVGAALENFETIFFR